MPPEPELLQRFSAAPACYETFVSIPHLPHSYQRHCSCDPPSFVKDHREHFLCRGGLHRTLTYKFNPEMLIRKSWEQKPRSSDRLDDRVRRNCSTRETMPRNRL